nr:MAG TPA: hypothetical protein [Caudoviricetes sp.]
MDIVNDIEHYLPIPITDIGRHVTPCDHSFLAWYCTINLSMWISK